MYGYVAREDVNGNLIYIFFPVGRVPWVGYEVHGGVGRDVFWDKEATQDPLEVLESFSRVGRQRRRRLFHVSGEEDGYGSVQDVAVEDL